MKKKIIVTTRKYKQLIFCLTLFIIKVFVITNNLVLHKFNFSNKLFKYSHDTSY